MAVYKTPDVFVEEISTLPPSVAEVSTAIPAFIGYTAIAPDAPDIVPVRITSFLEFTTLFGGPAPVKFTATINGNAVESVKIAEDDPMQIHKLYYAMDLYFKNGGSDCYIVSLGKYDTYDKSKAKAAFETGIDSLITEDEPTLIVLSEAATLAANDYYDLCKLALDQCAKLQDRFCIFDVRPAGEADKESSVQQFRNGIGTRDLKYGAAYYPYLNTSLSFAYDEANVQVTGSVDPASPLSDLKQSQTALYNTVKQELMKFKVVLPPAPAIAGVYAYTDRTRGVWKAPANVSLNAVISPFTKISASDQENLNVDTTGGKSVNAIRSFVGKGTLVWGARTLAGNDNEWRYVPVRRLFIMIEESAKKASYFAVFEPNDAGTWLKVKGMIESFLYSLWQQGALAGSTSKAAYYVNVGLGTTMTTQDVLEGRMIVEIGIAAVRPAEFIILRFSHKLQEV